MRTFDAIVVHSGGMDSSLCLARAIELHGADRVLSVTFIYGQRHANEVDAARRICELLGVENVRVPISCLNVVTDNALMNVDQEIGTSADGTPTTLVMGRNGLMARVAAIHAAHVRAKCIYMGVIEVEEANSGYRDCSRAYMDLVQAALRMDLGDDGFEIRTPVVKMTKAETMAFGDGMGVLEMLLEETITCYRGIARQGCGACPACDLRNEGLRQFLAEAADKTPDGGRSQARDR